jgi:hypothetical protein
MVDARGQVVATVFAALTGTGRPGGFALPNSLLAAQLAKLAAGGGGPVSSGPCGD